MTELQFLQKRFDDIALEFPRVIHVLSVWPKDDKEPQFTREHAPSNGNLVGIWNDSLVGEYIPGKKMKHWLIKSPRESWDINAARGNFQSLAEKAGQIIFEKGFLSKSIMLQNIPWSSEHKLINDEAIQLWVLFAHEFGNTERFVYKPDDIKKNLIADLPTTKYGSKSVKKLSKGPILSFFEVQKDFFYESSSVISQPLKIEDAPKKMFSERQLKVWNLLKNNCFSAKEMCKPLDLFEENVRQHIRAIRKKHSKEIIITEPSRGYWRPDAPPPDYQQFLSCREISVSSQQEHGNN